MRNKRYVFSILVSAVLLSCSLVTPKAIESTLTPIAVPPTVAPQAPEPTQAQPVADTAAPATSQPAPTRAPFSISSPDFENGQPIPKRYTCDAENISPAINWNGAPDNTRSLALITEDIDAPSGIFVHWVFYNLPATAMGELPEGPSLQVGTNGQNTFNQMAYGGPCPPAGKAHRYIFHLYALDLNPDLPSGLTAAKLRQTMNNHILAEAQWMGTYQK
jgi:Raf kinase inhibitor-like YbhB/YbcL family protein